MYKVFMRRTLEYIFHLSHFKPHHFGEKKIWEEIVSSLITRFHQQSKTSQSILFAKNRC